MLLAIDTSTNFASLALADGPILLAELNWRVGQRHGSETLERARWLLMEQGVTMGRLDGIAVALGPGSFNGVRVALATAKTLAFALNIPLYGIPTLDICAWGARLTADPIWSLLEAGRGEVYAACYQPAAEAQGWAPVTSAEARGERGASDGASAYHIIAPHDLAAQISERVVFTGEWRDTTREALAQALGERARFTSPLAGRRGAWLAELASARAQHGDADDPHTLEPLYLRRPAITTSVRAIGARDGVPAETQPRTEAARSDGEEEARAL